MRLLTSCERRPAARWARRQHCRSPGLYAKQPLSRFPCCRAIGGAILGGANSNGIEVQPPAATGLAAAAGIAITNTNTGSIVVGAGGIGINFEDSGTLAAMGLIRATGARKRLDQRLRVLDRDGSPILARSMVSCSRRWQCAHQRRPDHGHRQRRCQPGRRFRPFIRRNLRPDAERHAGAARHPVTAGTTLSRTGPASIDTQHSRARCAALVQPGLYANGVHLHRGRDQRCWRRQCRQF